MTNFCIIRIVSTLFRLKREIYYKYSMQYLKSIMHASFIRLYKAKEGNRASCDSQIYIHSELIYCNY